MKRVMGLVAALYAAGAEAAPPAAAREAAGQALKATFAQRGLTDVTLSEAPGPAGSTAVVATAKGATPGADRLTCIVDNKRAWGAACGADPSPFIWRVGCTGPGRLVLADAVAALRYGVFDDLLAAEAPGPTGWCGRDRLVVRFDRMGWPRGPKETVEVVVTPRGPVSVTVTRPTPAAESPLAALKTALDRDDGAAVTAATRAVAALPNLGADGLALLGRVAALPAVPLAMVAVEVMPATPEAAKAYGQAWRPLSEAVRTERLGWVRGLHGAARADAVSAALR